MSRRDVDSLMSDYCRISSCGLESMSQAFVSSSRWSAVAGAVWKKSGASQRWAAADGSQLAGVAEISE